MELELRIESFTRTETRPVPAVCIGLRPAHDHDQIRLINVTVTVYMSCDHDVLKFYNVRRLQEIGLRGKSPSRPATADSRSKFQLAIYVLSLAQRLRPVDFLVVKCNRQKLN